MIPYPGFDRELYISTLADLKMQIGIQQEFEQSLERKLEQLREMENSSGTLAQELLCIAQIEFLLISSRQVRMGYEAQARNMERIIDSPPPISFPAPALTFGPGFGPRLPTRDDGNVTTDWACTACGATGSLEHAPDICFSNVCILVRHSCPRQGDFDGLKISLTLTPAPMPKDLR